ncbi:hypothetical protein GF362_06350 [Candidatus Dojkabacteria bacterium]|nr:hypothetical protein [Candidatus Dojkabacteria bacterium]
MQSTLLRERIVYRFFWEFFSKNLQLFFIFGLYLFIILYPSHNKPLLVLLSFLLGIIFKQVIDLFNRKYSKLIANTSIIFFCGIGIILSGEINNYLLLFLFVLGGYSLIAASTEYFIQTTKPVLKGIIYFLFQIHRICWFFLLSFFLLISNKDVFGFFPESNVFSFNIRASIFYLLINLSIFIFSYLLSHSILITRSSLIAYTGNKLEEISNWSIDKQVIKNNLLNGDMILMQRRRTIVFGDIRGFTSFSNKHDIKLVLEVLEKFYTLVEEYVYQYQGYKPEFIADEFVTFFDEISDAIKFSVDFNKKINSYLKKFSLGLGIGLDSGNVLEGVIGGPGSKKYTVLGRVVNRAAHIQETAKGGQILATKKSVKNQKRVKYELKEGIKIKGKKPRFDIVQIKGYDDEYVLGRNYFRNIRKILSTPFELMKKTIHDCIIFFQNK